MGLFYALFAKKIRLLKVDIQFTGKSYSVSFEKLHPDTKDIEFVYLFIYHFAKILYVFPATFPEKAMFLKEIEALNINDNISDQLKTIDSNLANHYVVNPSGNRKISSTLTYKNTYSRGIYTTLPKKTMALDALRTITIMGLDAFNHIGTLESNILKNAIYYQISLYLNGVNPRSMNSIIQLPIDVFQFALRNRDILED